MNVEKGIINSEKLQTSKKARAKNFLIFSAVSASTMFVNQYDKGMSPYPQPDFTHGHIVDGITPIALSYLSRVGWGKDKYLNTMFGFVASLSSELFQKTPLSSGTFDPKDIVSYGIGTSIYFTLETIKERKQTKMEQGITYSVGNENS